MPYLLFCYCFLFTLSSCGSLEGDSQSMIKSNPSKSSVPDTHRNITLLDTTKTDSTALKIVRESNLNVPVGYHLDEPMKSLELPSKLKEISGLDIIDQKALLAVVQDEKGNLYLVNKYDGKIETKIDFGKDGDYEGVEIVGNAGYVVNSSGTIYEITDISQERSTINKYNTFLKSINDVEGLAYDSKNNCLLLACKGRPAEGEGLDDLRQNKAIYAFDLKTKTLQKKPAFIISLSAVQEYLKNSAADDISKKVREQFEPGVKSLQFNPSALAFHPQTDLLYILSSAGKTFMILDRSGNIRHLGRLKKKIHTQPEGIAFSSDGTLYISNEGSGNKGKIHVFKPREN
jgi:uncharacterized protein YjiK